MTHEKDDIDRIAERLGAHPLDDPESRDRGFDKEFEGAREGHVFRLYAYRLEIASPPHITLHIAVSLPKRVTLAVIRFCREDSVDRLGKSLRIAREHRTGDETFDAAVLVDTAAADETLRRLLQPEVRASITEILALPIDDIRLAGAARYGGFIDADPSTDEPTLLVATISAKSLWSDSLDALPSLLVALARALARAHDDRSVAGDPYRAQPSTTEEAPEIARPVRRSGGIFAAMLVVGLWVCALWFSGPAELGGALLLKQLAAMAALFVAAAGALVLLLRGRPTSLSLVIASLLALNVAPLIAGFRSVQWFNATYAPAGERPLVGEVRFERMPRNAARRSVILYIDGTLTPLTGAMRDGYATDTRTPVRVVVRDGALGAPWIVRIERAGPPVPTPAP